MKIRPIDIPALLNRLEGFYGPQQPCWPIEPFLFLVWWHCGYPAGDLRCARGWGALKAQLAVEPRQILAASLGQLTAALKAGGMVPELRAMRIQEIAARVLDEFSGDLKRALAGPLADVRRNLKKFPGISDPGADRILLFSRTAPVPAVPSNTPHPLVRIALGPESENYLATYREAQNLIAGGVPEEYEARQRAYLLLKVHGQQICTRKPKCGRCPVSDHCAFAVRSREASRSKG